jgi:hypothetical protein
MIDRFLEKLMAAAEIKALLSDEHFSIERINGQDEPPPPP